MLQQILIKNREEMANLAQIIAKNAKKGDIFGLKGGLGAGKSFFANAFINALCEHKINVLSPTFNLVYSYDTKKGEIFHFDLYRLKTVEELENIGFFDVLQNNICLIEWPQIAQNFLKKNYTEIEILIKSEQEREILIKN